jgi:hypothetical protein
LSVQRFCQEQGLTQYSFLRLTQTPPEERTGTVRLGGKRRDKAGDDDRGGFGVGVGDGEPLRISAGVDGATLRTVLEALRA